MLRSKTRIVSNSNWTVAELLLRKIIEDFRKIVSEKISFNWIWVFTTLLQLQLNECSDALVLLNLNLGVIRTDDSLIIVIYFFLFLWFDLIS